MTSAATSPPLVAEPEPLTGTERQAALEVLASNAEWMTYGDVTAELARLAHRSLPPARRAYLFESHRELSERVAALKAGVADWTEFFDDGDFLPSCGDVQDAAAELLADRAGELLFELVHGNGEK